jgi:hypothetical protein
MITHLDELIDLKICKNSKKIIKKDKITNKSIKVKRTYDAHLEQSLITRCCYTVNQQAQVDFFADDALRIAFDALFSKICEYMEASVVKQP